MEDFYVYAYLDQRKRGNYSYNNICFLYEPFYIGKGKNKRMYEHIRPYNLKKKNLRSNKINKILNETKNYPYIVKIKDNMSEESAFEFEKECIKWIGKRNNSTGCLLNLLDGGDGSFSGNMGIHWNHKHNPETIEKIKTARKIQKIDDVYRNNLSKSMRGKKKSAEHSLNISKGKRGIATFRHTRESKTKLSNSIKGIKHHSSKEYIFINPNGEQIKIYSNFQKFVSDNDLTLLTVKKYINKGKIPSPPPRANNLTNTRKNTTGWEIICPSKL